MKLKKQKNNIRHINVLRKAENVADQVLQLVNEFDLKAAAFGRKTNEFKEQLRNGKTLDDILIDVFATAYKAIKDVYGISLHKVQIMGAYALHKGDVAEMKTGEGKTLTAILPAYLNSLEGKGVHIITVNEYLAKRDSFNTGKVFKLLGVSTGFISSEFDNSEKKINYYKDITYSTNAEIGFDYLRDNMVLEKEQKVQRPFNYAIVDEVDSILIDEARTPLIISGGSFVTSEEYTEADSFVKTLLEEDIKIDLETKRCFLTDTGVAKAENYFNLEHLYKNDNAILVHRISNALQANNLFEYDVDYTIKDDEIVLIDIFTGRLLIGRQFSEGLNQAIEAKEGVKINAETRTVASITYQNLFRMYKKLSGMSGTALPEEEEFLQVYNMRVLPIPTNKPLIRVDLPDIIFATKSAKIKRIVSLIKEIHQTGQPILVGTRSVQDSQELADLLIEDDLNVEILNAKNHAREAEIILKAGEIDAITISTNMAGRGTDIKLADGVLEKGGLFVIGTERHESRRIDDQLRGRSGRQGDIGYTRFFVSLEDELIKRSGMDKFARFQKSLNENPIESKLIGKSLNSAQKRIEGNNYDHRKSIIEYDDVLNNQRIKTYKQRDLFLSTSKPREILVEMVKKLTFDISKNETSFLDGKFNSNKYFDNITEMIKNIKFETNELLLEEEAIELANKELIKYIENKYKHLEDEFEFKVDKFLRHALVKVLDKEWTEQIDRLTKLKTGIRYRQYAQKNPVQLYVFESKDLFDLFKKKFRENFLIFIFDFEVNKDMMKKPEEHEKRKTNDLIVS